MICNCNNNNNPSSEDIAIRIVNGNVLKLAIPLTLRTIEMENGEVVHTDTDFIPSDEYPVNICFAKDGIKFPIEATMKNGNVAYIEDKGTIPVGTYSITITCNDDNGNPYRFKQKAVLYVADATKDAGIEQPIEFDVQTWYLDSAIYLCLKGEDGVDGQDGADGVGIEDITITPSTEVGGTNIVTIILTNGEQRTFEVLNGSGSVDSIFNINSNHPVANSLITGKFNTIDNQIANLFGDVDYDSVNKRIRFYNSGKTRVIATLSAVPFVKDGMVNSVYISNNTLVITFNTDAGREAIAVPLSSVFNPNNYYNKTQVDNRISSSIAPLQTSINTINNTIRNLDSRFARLTNNGKVLYSQAPEFVLDFIELPNGDDDDNKEILIYGMLYGKSNGHISYVDSDGVDLQEIDLGTSMRIVFFNLDMSAWYRWDGTAWEMVSASGSSADLSNYYTKTEIDNKGYLTQHQDISGKVDKEQGKGLSTNDYTTAEKQKLAGLSPQVQADWEESDTSSPAYIQHKPTIPTAINGKSAYQIAVDNGFVGTEAQWIESLHGTDGQDGKDGADGKDGTNGTNGINGQDGADGQDGQDGKSAYQSYLDTTSDDPVKTEAQWVASLKGEKGDTGATGAKGDKGDKGDSGVSLGEVVLEQSAGNSTTSVMSQKAVTDEIEMSPAFKSTYPLMCLKCDGAVISTEKYKKFLFDDLKFVDVTTRFMLIEVDHYYQLQNLFTIAADSSNYITTSFAGNYELTFVNYKNGQKVNESTAIAHSSICLDNHNICFDFYTKRIILTKCTNTGVQAVSAVVDISSWDLSGLTGKDVYFAKKIFSYESSSSAGMLFSQVMVNYPSSLLVNDVLNKRTMPHTVRVFETIKESGLINSSNNITGISNYGCTVVSSISDTHKILGFSSNTEQLIGFGGIGSNVWLPNKNACLAVKFKLLSGTPTFNNNYNKMFVISDDGAISKIQDVSFVQDKEYILTTKIKTVRNTNMDYDSNFMMKASGEFTFEVYDPIVVYPVAQEICAENVYGNIVCGDIPFDAKEVSFVPYINGRLRYGDNSNYAFYHNGEIKFDTSGKVYMWNGSVWKQISNA